MTISLTILTFPGFRHFLVIPFGTSRLVTRFLGAVTCFCWYSSISSPGSAWLDSSTLIICSGSLLSLDKRVHSAFVGGCREKTLVPSWSPKVGEKHHLRRYIKIWGLTPEEVTQRKPVSWFTVKTVFSIKEWLEKGMEWSAHQFSVSKIVHNSTAVSCWNTPTCIYWNLHETVVVKITQNIMEQKH